MQSYHNTANARYCSWLGLPTLSLIRLLLRCCCRNHSSFAALSCHASNVSRPHTNVLDPPPCQYVHDIGSTRRTSTSTSSDSACTIANSEQGELATPGVAATVARHESSSSSADGCRGGLHADEDQRDDDGSRVPLVDLGHHAASDRVRVDHLQGSRAEPRAVLVLQWHQLQSTVYHGIHHTQCRWIQEGHAGEH